MTLRTTLLGAAAAVGLALTAGAAHASIIASLGPSAGAPPSVTFNGGTGNFDYTYQLTLSSSETASTGAQFALYDFGPVAGALPFATTGLASTANFTYAQGNAPLLDGGAVNNPNINDVYLTYKGTTTLSGASLGNGATGNLGSFTLESASGSFAAFASKQASSATNAQTGLGDTNQTSAFLPVASVPEPATLAVLGSALCGLGLFRRRRQG